MLKSEAATSVWSLSAHAYLFFRFSARYDATQGLPEAKQNKLFLGINQSAGRPTGQRTQHLEAPSVSCSLWPMWIHQRGSRTAEAGVGWGLNLGPAAHKSMVCVLPQPTPSHAENQARQ